MSELKIKMEKKEREIDLGKDPDAVEYVNGKTSIAVECKKMRQWFALHVASVSYRVWVRSQGQAKIELKNGAATRHTIVIKIQGSDI